MISFKVFLTYTLKKNSLPIEKITPDMEEDTNVTSKFRGYSIMELLEDIISLDILQKFSDYRIIYRWDQVNVKYTSFNIIGNVDKFQ